MPVPGDSPALGTGKFMRRWLDEKNGDVVCGIGLASGGIWM